MSAPGRTAIVTGGGQGIGRATAGHLLGLGFDVVIAETDAEAGRETEREYGARGHIRFIACDVSREDQVRVLMDTTMETFGRLDLLVNNAAISRRKPLAGLLLEEWNAVLGVNLTGPMLCSKYAAPHLAAAGGAIVNIASTRALMSEADTEAYSASKGGLAALTHALAVSLGPQVRVNCISPGWIETGDWKKRSRRRPPAHSERDHLQHPAGRVGRPEDIATLVGFLASGEAGFITGANFVVDGGMTRKMIYEE